MYKNNLIFFVLLGSSHRYSKNFSDERWFWILLYSEERNGVVYTKPIKSLKYADDVNMSD